MEMVAVLESCGAFVYGCTEEEADRRIGRSRGGLDYDGKGNRRDDGGMVGWLFMDMDIVRHIKDIGCTAVYLAKSCQKEKDYIKVRAGREVDFLDLAIQKMIKKKEDGYGNKIAAR